MSFQFTRDSNNKRRLVDPATNTELKFVSGIDRESENDLLLLHWNSLQIPLIVKYEIVNKEQTVIKIVVLGDPRNSLANDDHESSAEMRKAHRIFDGVLAKHPSIERVTLDDAQRSACELKAIEALVCFGFNFGGLQRSDGAFRVQIDRGPNSGTYTLSSFGYQGTKPGETA